MLGPDGALMLSESLPTNRHLRALYLFQNRLGDEGAGHLAALLRADTAPPALTGLYLPFNAIGMAGGLLLGRALATNTTLTTLNLSDNQLDDVAAAAFGNALSKNPAVQVLQLANNKIADAGAAALAAGLSGNRNLRELK